MAFALLGSQSPSADNGSGSAKTTGSADTSGATLITVPFTFLAGTRPTITDSKGNTYSYSTVFGNGSSKACVAYCIAPTVGSGHTWTLTSPGSNPLFVFTAKWYSGAGTITVDNAGVGGGTDSSVSTFAAGTLTPGHANELLESAFGGGTSESGFSVDVGFTLDQSVAGLGSNHFSFATAHQIQTTLTARNLSYSWSGAEYAASVVIAFNASTIFTQALSATQAQTATISASKTTAKTLSATQGQTASVTTQRTKLKTLSATQGQTATIRRTTNKTLRATQAQVATAARSIVYARPALIFINVDGIPRAYDRDAVNGSIDSGSLFIQDILDQTPNTCQFVARGFTPHVGMRVVMALGGIDNPSRIFAGSILTVNPIYVGTPANQAFNVSCIDDTWLLNKVKVIKTYTAMSATAIAIDLMTTYAAGFTTAHVEASLDTIDIITFTNTDLTDALTQLAKRIGGYWRIDYFDDLWFGTAESDGAQPVDLTSSHPSLSEFASSTTISDIITRCLVEGGGVNALSAVAVGETILPVDLISVNGVAPWYNTLGGKVVCGTQRLMYTGVQVGGAGSLVGPGIGPASAPTLALAAGAGVESGAHSYAYTFVTAGGESLPSPVASITVGAISAPVSAPTIGTVTPFTGGVDSGNHFYKVTFVNAAGETTPGPFSALAQVSLVLPATSGQIPLSAIPIGDATVTARKVYRTATPGGGAYKLAFTISNNTDTTATDTTPDASLGAAAPSSNTATANRVNLSAIQTYSGTGTVTQRKLYRTAAGATQLQLLATLANNTTTTYADSTADASLGANVPTSDASGLPQPTGQVLAGATSLLSAGVGWASASGGWAVIGNGTQVIRYTGFGGTTQPTTVATLAANGGAGIEAGQHQYAYTWVSAVGESLPSTASNITLGGGSLQVNLSTITVGPTGTTARKIYRTAANDSVLKLLHTIADNTTTTYTDTAADATLGATPPTSDTSVLSGLSLLGIPAAGIGAIVATINYSSTVTAAPCLTGIPSSSTGSILYAINKGDPVNLLVQVDDAAAQAELSALLDPSNLLGGAAGIREDYIQDGRISETEARARGTAQLALMSTAQLSVTYKCRDPLTASGRTITINLPSPTSIATSLKIQQVTISNFKAAATFFPDYAVQASNVRYSFEDLLQGARKLLNG